MYKKTDSSTQHGLKTPHGWRTPHRFPVKTSTSEDLLRIVGMLYPTGRAWYMPENSNFNNLHSALNKSFLRLINDGYASIDSNFPDNENFDDQDASLWEYRLGLNDSSHLTIEQRREIIYRKMAFPQNIKARQGNLYIQEQLNQSGFKVKVYENVFHDNDGQLFYKTPTDILDLQTAAVQHGEGTQHGAGTQHGGGNIEVIANSIESENYNVGGNLWATFFIAGNTLDQVANIEKSREREFRELVLKLKPAHLVAYIFVNYI